MNYEYDGTNNNLHTEYKSYLESLSRKQLLCYLDDVKKEELIEIIQDRDPVGKGDCEYER